MCLAIPGKVLQIEEQDGLRLGRVQFGGIVRAVRLDFVRSPEQQKEWNGYRQNELLAPVKYKARPRNGIWATPPYLHNEYLKTL